MSPDQIELQEAFRTDANPQASDDLARKTLLAKVATFLESLNSRELE
jgi:hypothetical protein